MPGRKPWMLGDSETWNVKPNRRFPGTGNFSAEGYPIQQDRPAPFFASTTQWSSILTIRVEATDI